jgi:hypothetical protein
VEVESMNINKQRTKIMKVIIALTVLIIASIATAAEPTRRVTVNGQDWDIEVVSGSNAQHAAILSQQPWFGHKTLARDFLIAYMGLEEGVPKDYVFPPDNNVYGKRSTYFTFYDVLSEDGNLVGANYYLVYRPDYLVDRPDLPISGCILDAHERQGYYTCQLESRVISEYDCEGLEVFCYFAVATPVAGQPLAILPATGEYDGGGGTFDLVINVNEPDIYPVRSTLLFDGTDVNQVLASCWVKAPTSTGMSYTCAGVQWSAVGPGTHTFQVELEMTDGSFLTNDVTWTVY